ncbi:MAG: type II toxin-antitoxin system RelE/ParE family toxin [Candidatus Acetothermia bacterium]|jgi:mRNA interferase RelE/StbE|nr:type II toxin-antitoxin system RelE/ParE family toxin [Candidatus Acetothermia bacterium]MDH7505198.1 type II toxin-antitoxin system RelE/ParE family toxin [Candidatus Acetothermia bacterium]
MNWQVVYKPTFLRELARLPAEVRARVETFAFEVMPRTTNPYALSGVEKLKGYREYYKVRFGDYRIGLRFDKKAKTIEFCRVLHRRDLYRYFP